MEEHTGTGGGHPVSDADFEFVTIFRGSQAEVLAMRGLLEGQGFHAHVEGDFIKTLDPFITGGNVFEVELQVPRGEAEEALECLGECREQAARSPAEAAHENADDDAAAGVAPRRVAAAVFARRIRWGLALFLSLIPVSVFSPLAGFVGLAIYWIFGIEYLRRVRREGRAPVGHGMTIACLVFATVAFLTIWALVIQQVIGGS